MPTSVCPVCGWPLAVHLYTDLLVCKYVLWLRQPRSIITGIDAEPMGEPTEGARPERPATERSEPAPS